MPKYCADKHKHGVVSEAPCSNGAGKPTAQSIKPNYQLYKVDKYRHAVGLIRNCKMGYLAKKDKGRVRPDPSFISHIGTQGNPRSIIRARAHSARVTSWSGKKFALLYAKFGSIFARVCNHTDSLKKGEPGYIRRRHRSGVGSFGKAGYASLKRYRKAAIVVR